MGKELWKNVGVLVGAALFIVAVSALAIWGMVEWLGMSYSESARLFQAVGAVTVIFIGGVFAYWRLQIFRTFEPHLGVTHEISHRVVGDSYIHFFVTASLHNNSKVKIELRQVLFSLQLVSPITDVDMENLYRKRQDDVDDVYTYYIQWPTLDEIEHRWTENELIIEPGESHQETVEFITTSNVESAMIYTYFYNPTYSQNSRSAEGWSITTVYDIN